MNEKLKEALLLLWQASETAGRAALIIERLEAQTAVQERAATAARAKPTPAYDATDSLRAVCAAKVGLTGVTVGQVITDASLYLLHYQTLEGHGVALTEGRPGPRQTALEGKKFVFLDCDQVKRMLLKDGAWKYLDVEQVLLRLPGAAHAQRRIGGRRAWSVELPLELVTQAMREGDADHVAHDQADAEEGPCGADSSHVARDQADGHDAASSRCTCEYKAEYPCPSCAAR